MDTPVMCDACDEERRRSARIFRNVCITLRFADFSLREGGRAVLARFGQVLSVIASHLEMARPTSRISWRGVYESASETRFTRRAGLRASIEGLVVHLHP